MKKQIPQKQVNYDHSKNIHSTLGAERGFKSIFNELEMPTSLIDVGCGAGFWLAAAAKYGVTKIQGIDGIKANQLMINDSYILIADLSKDYSNLFSEKYDIALCLEVAEHLDEKYAANFIKNLVDLSDTILFAAAIPGQPGQHHVNCQWPGYWQAEFNKHGFYCDDLIRWKIWSEPDVEPWYRENIFIARKDLNRAGSEPRILPVIHPEMMRHIIPSMYWKLVSEGKISKKSVLKNFLDSYLA